MHIRKNIVCRYVCMYKPTRRAFILCILTDIFRIISTDALILNLVDILTSAGINRA